MRATPPSSTRIGPRVHAADDRFGRIGYQAGHAGVGDAAVKTIQCGSTSRRSTGRDVVLHDVARGGAPAGTLTALTSVDGQNP